MKGSYYNIDQQSAPEFFIQGPSAIARFVFFSTLSLALIATDTQLHYLSAVRQQLERYLHPLQLMVNAPNELYHYTDHYLTSHHQLLAENKALKNRMMKGRVSLQNLKLLEIENANLRRILNVKDRLTQESVLGEILYTSSDQFTKKVVVDRGKAHGVKIGAAVVDANGIVGQVTGLYPQTSVVTMITDKTVQIPVMVERNGLRAIVFGRGQNNRLEILYLPVNVDIKVGDTLTTSGIDGIYPSGMVVAKVESISTASGSAFATILCRPVGGVDSHRHILIVNPKEANPFEETDNASETSLDDTEPQQKQTAAQEKVVSSKVLQQSATGLVRKVEHATQ